MQLDRTHHDERPQPDYRDFFDIGRGSDDDDSFRNRRPTRPEEEEERTIH
jgi:hypothetical protein